MQSTFKCQIKHEMQRKFMVKKIESCLFNTKLFYFSRFNKMKNVTLNCRHMTFGEFVYVVVNIIGIKYWKFSCLEKANETNKFWIIFLNSIKKKLIEKYETLIYISVLEHLIKIKTFYYLFQVHRLKSSRLIFQWLFNL